MIKLETISKHFIELRKSKKDKHGKDMPVVQLAQELLDKKCITNYSVDIIRQEIGKTEKGKFPQPFLIEGYSKYFNVTSDFLLGLRETKSVDENIAMINKVTGLDENAINTLKNCTPLYISVINKLLSSDAIDKLIHAYTYNKVHYFQQIQIVDKVIGVTTLNDQENINYHKYQSIEYLKELLEILSEDYELFEKLCDNHKIETWKRYIDYGIEALGEKANLNNFLIHNNVPNEVKEYIKSKIQKGE